MIIDTTKNKTTKRRKRFFLVSVGRFSSATDAVVVPSSRHGNRFAAVLLLSTLTDATEFKLTGVQGGLDTGCTNPVLGHCWSGHVDIRPGELKSRVRR